MKTIKTTDGKIGLEMSHGKFIFYLPRSVDGERWSAIHDTVKNLFCRKYPAWTRKPKEKPKRKHNVKAAWV